MIRPALIKTSGYLVSIVSVVLLGVVSFKSAGRDPVLTVSLVGGMLTSVVGMALRWLSYEVEKK